MDPVSIIVMALVSGAASALKPTTEQVVKDAYAGIKGLIQHKFGHVDISVLEADPASKARQGVIKENLVKVGAGQDEELLSKAKTLLDAIQTHAPDVPKAVGLDLEDIKGASLTAQRILAEGPHATGVKLKGAEIQGDITFSDVAARSGENTALKKSLESSADESHSSATVILQKVTAGGNILIGGNVYTRSDLEELEEYLSRAVSDYERDMSQTVLRMSMPPHPYKFLDSFGLKDEPIFFGREAATEELCKTVLRDRLTVLHAKSGAGKTSLLNAGLSPRFIREGRLPLYVHAFYQDEDPVVVIKRSIASAVHGPWPRLLHDLPLHVFLGLVCKRLSSHIHELVIILDQFEQFFIRWSLPEARRDFIKALSICYDDQTLPLRFIIALRKDYYSDLGEFKRVVPHLHVFHNDYRLDPMTMEEIEAAITRPLAKQGISLTYEPALLDTLLVDLTHNGMELPLLQITCTQLYETRARDDVSITPKTYEALGRAEGVLNNYLKSVLADLLGREEVLAKDVLKELVRSDGTKQVLSYRTLVARVGVNGDKLGHVLGRLVQAYLLHRDEMLGEITYELAHEYLATEIVKWMSPADQEFKQVEELLQRELVNWRTHHMLIPRNRLEVLYPYRERFKDVDAEAWRCLINSALAEDFAVADWIQTAGALGQLVLFQVLKIEDVEIRRRGVKTLGQIGDPRAVEPLIGALKDEAREVRQWAASALGQIGDPRAVEPLMAALKDEAREVWQWAAKDEAREVRQLIPEALGQIGDPAVEPLIGALKDEDHVVRQWAASALGQIGDPRAVEPLMAALKDEAREVRQLAANALGYMRDSRAIEPLIVALKDQDEEVMWRAVVALGKIGDPRVVESLMAALKDEDEEVRQFAASALEQIGTAEAVSALKNARKEGMGEV